MKETFNNYKEIFISFLKNKKYLLSIIFIAILSYGFTITNYSIGIDDLCFDRYVQGTYILSAQRWGTWLLYNVLHITTFSPFWLDFIVAVFMVIIATTICTVIKRILKDKVNIFAYIVFSGIVISSPMVCQFFIYQSTNLTVVISNLLVIFSAIILFENLFYIKNQWIYLIPAPILVFAISMYEACAQTFLVMLLILGLLKLMEDKTKAKEIIKLILYGILSLFIGIMGYYLIGNIIIIILQKMDLLTKDYAMHSIMWLEESFISSSLTEKLNTINENLCLPLIDGIKNYLPVTIFAITSIISILIGIIKSIKKKQCMIILLILAMIITNFALIILQLYVLYRIQFSWIVTTAFLSFFIYIEASKHKISKYITSILLILLLIIQTNNMNNTFYEEHKRFEKEKQIANEIAMDILECENYNEKFIIYTLKEIPENPFQGYLDNKSYVLIWGSYAFEEYGIELTKFINNFGYDFKPSTLKDYAAMIANNEDLFNEKQNEKIIEIENYIIVNLDNYFAKYK